MSTELTKKQQKAQAFRAKQKAKKRGRDEIDIQDVPELDVNEDDEGKVETNDQPNSNVKEGKKRKREVEVKVEPGPSGTHEDTAKDVKLDLLAKRDDGIGKGKGKGKGKKNAWEEGEDEEEEKPGKKSKKDVKQRFILFIGNIGFKTTREEVERHFEQALEHKPTFRLLTDKSGSKTPTKPGQSSTSLVKPEKSRGIGFLELPTSTLLQSALKLHQSELNGRRINVELTAGGGGSSVTRKEKIKERNERVGNQRERRAEKEAEEGGGVVKDEIFDEPRARKRKRNGNQGDHKSSGGGNGGTEVIDGPDGQVKIRGGRRVKVKSSGANETQPHSGGSSNHSRANGYRAGPDSGRGRGRGRGGFGGGGGGRRPWQPTGANAMVVG